MGTESCAHQNFKVIFGSSLPIYILDLVRSGRSFFPRFIYLNYSKYLVSFYQVENAFLIKKFFYKNLYNEINDCLRYFN